MFDSLSDRLGSALKSVTGQAKLTEENIKDTLREVRMALLEADVALPAVKAFIRFAHYIAKLVVHNTKEYLARI